MNQLYDVVVLGAGPAGLANAIHLQRSGRRVLVVERNDGKRRVRIGEHLPPIGCELLRKAGFWDLVQSDQHVACYGIRSAWNSNEPEYQDYVLSPHGSYGLNLCRDTFDRSLQAHLVQHGGEVVHETRVIDSRFERESWTLKLRGTSTCSITARFVIDATGQSAWFARRQGIERPPHDRLIAIARHAIQDVPPDNHSVLIEPVDGGWWYSAGLAQSRTVVCFVTDRETVAKSDGDVDQVFSTHRCQAREISHALRGPKTWSPTVVRRVETGILTDVCDQRWIAVGDAAVTFDPLSSLGLFKSFSHLDLVRSIVDRCPHAERLYRETLAKSFLEYCDDRDYFYSQAKGGSTFWRRRVAASLHEPAG